VMIAEEIQCPSWSGLLPLPGYMHNFTPNWAPTEE
jgi:hypothetical protein